MFLLRRLARLLGRWALGWLVAVPLLGLAAPLVVHEDTPQLDLWPSVSILPDPGRQLDIAQILQQAAQFEPPRGAHSTLGLRPEPVWLRVPFSVDASAGLQRVLDIDYPVLNRIDAYLVRGGQIEQQALMGNLQMDPEHPRASRSHSMIVQLQPGQSYTLLLRIETTGAMVVPITLSTPAAFLVQALREQMLQGLMIGLSLCLLAYSLTHWLGLRDLVFMKYALIVGGGLLFSLLQFGIGAQYLWPGNHWMELHLAPLAALMSSCGFFLFFEHVLLGPDSHRFFSRVMKGGAMLTVVVALVFAADGLTTRAVSAIIGVLGLTPTLLALPGAIRRVRQGDSMGIYILLGALLYFSAAATMTGVIFGRIPMNGWTQHSVQLATLLDTMLLMRLLSLRSTAVQHAAKRANQERDAMHSLAHTDPLTGLPNRRGLSAALTAALPHCTIDNLVAIFVLDLDGFKPVNDRHGHDVGDELLIAVADRLQQLMRHNDVVARMGGDEFVVMAGGLLRDEQAQELGQELLDAFREPFQLREQRCLVGMTIGYALAPHDGSDALTLIKRADAAMYLGKQEGKHCLRRTDAEPTAPGLLEALA
ncbi:diguanylate cyclase (GGDEF)-like protein [Rhodoferax ferrireducens]|uniref:Diguanylate cyclase (GGDEF)-like protein n=2 Tax=Rhodoferax ferrireducens TaxID=192843 RepID=A0ABU2C971_9BURK|nr:diguanylate cyclase (GGDEF)-like protein [Rhodoferax ferrireducens]